MRSRDVRRVLDTGRRVHGELVVLVLAPGAGATAVVAGKRIGGAVERNRARRIVRAALREVAPAREGQDLVAIAKPSIRGRSANDLVSELRGLLSR